MSPDAADAALAAHLAEAAGRVLREVRATGGLVGGTLGRCGDHTANALLVEALRALRPDDGLLSEETKCDGTRLDKARVWIVDPLDGTREFGEGRDDWAVHVALAIDGVAHVGAVALPARGEVWRSDRPHAAPVHHGRLRIVVSRTRAVPCVARLVEALDAEILPMGSAGAKAMAVVRGDADIYVHTGGQFEWDNAAPVAVAAACGLHCSRLDGTPLVYNRRDPSVPDLLICRPAFAPRILAALG